MKFIKPAIALVSVILLAASCGVSKRIIYFQNQDGETAAQVPPAEPIRLKPEDKISIIVNSKDVDLMTLYNLPFTTRQLGGQTMGLATGIPQGMSGYTIDPKGYIDFPVIGKIHIGGMTRSEVADHIKNTLIEGNYVKDAVVTVEYMNLSVSILGEVKTPGQYYINTDNLNILQAISMAGDLNVTGKRFVKVNRIVDGELQTYVLDLRDANSVYSSPAFYLQPKDVVYVEPTKKKANEASVNANTFASASFWTSIASLCTSIAVLIVNVVK